MTLSQLPLQSEIYTGLRTLKAFLRMQELRLYVSCHLGCDRACYGQKPIERLIRTPPGAREKCVRG